VTVNAGRAYRAAAAGRHTPFMATRTILVVEDEDSISLPLAAALEREGYATRVTGSAPEAIALAAELQPDLILLDVMLSDGSGLDVCREVRRHSSMPIIMLTARGDETDRVVGLELGADDYVVKPFSARELIARIRAVLRRIPDAEAPSPVPHAPSAPAEGALEIGGVTVDMAMRRATLDGAEIALTRREFDLLALLVRNAGTVLTRERVMDEVWDTNWFGSTKTLDVHVSSLRRKLGDDAVDSRYLHTVRGVGFRFASPDEPA
jgi:two-component system response regulator RegX3